MFTVITDPICFYTFLIEVEFPIQHPLIKRLLCGITNHRSYYSLGAVVIAFMIPAKGSVGHIFVDIDEALRTRGMENPDDEHNIIANHVLVHVSLSDETK